MTRESDKPATRRAATIRLAMLSVLPGDAERELDWLGQSEHERLVRITAPKRRRQFLAGRWLARETAGHFFGSSPRRWTVDCSSSGAPILASPAGVPIGASLSLSHSGDWVACALAEEPIGLDLECDPKPRDLAGLASFALSADEVAWLRALPGAALSEAFYRLWTLKEAQGKQRGTGLRLEISRQRTFRECAPDLACGFTWQGGGLTLAIVGPPGLRAELSGWDRAPAPQAWRDASSSLRPESGD